MSSREQILAGVKQNQPGYSELPDLSALTQLAYTNLPENFISMATTIGCKVHQVNTFEEIKTIINSNFETGVRKVSTITELKDIADTHNFMNEFPQQLADVELAIIKSDLAVAENGAIWINEKQMGQRALPFITQHLAVVVDVKNIVATMHNAYKVIGDSQYGFSSFIAGPSKTADIEQSLVIGAHGPRSMTIFLMGTA